MKTETGVAVVGGMVGTVFGATIGIVTVAMSEKIATLKPWQKALLVVGFAGGTGALSAVTLYVAYSPVTAAIRG